jgi:protein TonB
MKHRTTALAISTVLLFVGGSYAQQAKQDPTRATAAPDSAHPRKMIHRVPPIFPLEAREKGIGGMVVVAVEVDKEGNVTGAKIVEGDKIFWDACLSAVKESKYAPAEWQGLPAKTTYQIKFVFSP